MERDNETELCAVPSCLLSSLISVIYNRVMMVKQVLSQLLIADMDFLPDMDHNDGNSDTHINILKNLSHTELDIK